MAGIIKLKFRGRRARRAPGEMNKLEAKYAEHLESQRMLGEVAEWHYEAIKLRLAPKTFYDTDFLVMLPDGELQIHEVKGFWEDDARVKIKVAADKFPFRFFAFTWDRKLGWVAEEIG